MTMTPRSASLDGASISWDGRTLSAECGTFVRRWSLTRCGLATVGLTHRLRTWVDCAPREGDCDWRLFRMATERTEAHLQGVTVETVEDPPLMWPHVQAVVELAYPETELLLRYTVQVFPCVPGVRTQVAVRARRPMGRDDIPSYLMESYAERLVMQPAQLNRLAVGYYNDAQHRNHDDSPIMKRESRTGALAEPDRELYDWANLLVLDDDRHALALVKESHKCVNQRGIDTGAFVLTDEAVRVTGLGLTDNGYQPKRPWLPHDVYREAWATWCVPFEGGEPEGQLAVKRFDRARFQRRPERSARSRSNTWGTRNPGLGARAAAEQANVLKEIESCAELGIDGLAIDDGWQWPMAGNAPHPELDWRPDPDRFPNGWSVVREAAGRAGVELHLWMPGQQATLEQMLRNIEQGGFTGLKIDFLRFTTRDQLDEMIERVRRVVEHTGYRLSISWDVTEESPRVGYYVGRQFGSLHTSNRKGTYPGKRVRHIAYTPRLVLRDAWQLAHYINLNQVEIPVQDPEAVDPSVGNASAYGHDYCAAMALAGLPLFFQETHHLEGEARQRTRRVMHAWREHRREMAAGFVLPIGGQPCDGAWTGFQFYNPDQQTGYVLIFRELNAPEPTAQVPLHFLNGAKLAWRDVLDKTEWTDEAGTGRLDCVIADAPGFRWLRYSAAK